jgi:cytochrome c oxidase subunit 1
MKNTNTSVHPGIVAYGVITAAVLLLLMIFGLVMRLAQADWLALGPDRFYQLMTVHGAGMVGIAALGGAAIMWHFLSRYVTLSPRILIANLVLFLAGVVCILGAVLVGGFAAGWTFLYPLPAHAMGAWSVNSAGAFLIGLLLIGTGFLLFYLDAGRAILQRYGSLSRALGWPQLFRNQGEAPPPTVVASTMVLIVNTLGLTSGAAVLVISLINLYQPTFAIDPLLAKNMIYFFGHVFINATIYMAVIAVYEILPVYVGRPWKSNRVFLASWTASTLMVIIVYPHHLLMDFAMPTWANVVGHVISYTSGFPVLLVTAFGALTLVYRSAVRWTIPASLLMLGTFGWAAGVVPAIIDATIPVNLVMHNTVWVPGHFHFYLLVGMVPMVLGFLSHISRHSELRIEWAAFILFLLGALGFVTSFLFAGSHSVPRRYAVHMPEWLPYDRVGSVFAAVTVAGMLLFIAGLLLRLRSAAPKAIPDSA